jgi:hypothetical protein
VLTASKDQIIKVCKFFLTSKVSFMKGWGLNVDLFYLDPLFVIFAHFQLYDLRAMKELESFRGHRKDVTG